MDAQNLDSLSWIDLTSAAMLLFFLVLGFFRGFLWQMSRLVSLLLAWILANQFHPQVTSFFQETLGLFQEAEYATYIAFFVIFLGTLISLSVITMIVEKSVEKLHLTFYNRIGGGFIGVVQAIGLLVALVGMVYFVGPQSALAKEIGQSRTGRATHAVVGQLDGYLSEDILKLYGFRGTKGEKAAGDESAPPGDPKEGSQQRAPVPGSGTEGKDG